MAQVRFTAWLREVAPPEPLDVQGATVREALADVFARAPQVRSYLVDDQGRLRKHVCIFADGDRLPAAKALDHPIGPNSSLHVMQALSGG